MEGEPLPPDWDPLDLLSLDEGTFGGVGAYPAPPSLPTGTEAEDFVDSVLDLDRFRDGGGSAYPHSGRVDTPSFTDPNSSIPGSVLGPSTSVGDVPGAITGGLESSEVFNDEEIKELLARYSDPPELHTPGVETPARAITAHELTVESVVEKLTKTTVDDQGKTKFVLTEKAQNKLLAEFGIAEVDNPRSLENLARLKAELKRFHPIVLNKLDKTIDKTIDRTIHRTESQRTRAKNAPPEVKDAKKAYRKKYAGTVAEVTTRLEQDKKRLEKAAAKRARPVTRFDGVVDGGVGKRLRVVPVTALMAPIFVAAAVIAAVLADLNGWGGSESEKKLRAGAAGLGDGGEHSGAVTAQQGGWVGRAAEAYDSDSATLAGLSAVMADTDTTTAALLQAHDERLEITRTVIDSTDALLTVSDPIAVALEALPATGPALSVAFQLSVAVPALHACYSAEQHALHSSARTAAALQDATATYDYIHTTATTLI